MQKIVTKKPCSLAFAIKEANRCLLCKDAPCSQGCPAGTDPGKFIRQIKFENYKGAARTIRNNNPLGSICAYTCPVEKLCEKECTAKALENPIKIRELQEFAYLYGKDHRIESQTKQKSNGIKIAIIGAGPAGIGCAAELAKAGYAPMIFEKSNKAGGVATWTIPGYRLPDMAISYDLKNLAELGVRIKYNSRLASTNAVTNLFKQGFKSVFIATGLAEPFALPELRGNKNVIDYATFLTAAKTKPKSLNLKGKNVLVIGGGSVAVDSACSAVTLGAKKVYMMMLENLAHIPADREEVELANSMHIIIKPSSQLVGVKKNGKNEIVSIKGIEVEFPATKGFNPAFAKQIAGTEFGLNVDYIVEAIGTKPGAEISKIAPKVATKGKGTIVVKNNFATNVRGVFAGGDVVNGGATIVQAVAEGKKAAQSIIEFIRGK
jgi:dihydropyrimidine dehydrogenase (NAD+) subunit PreT